MIWYEFMVLGWLLVVLALWGSIAVLFVRFLLFLREIRKRKGE